jgi:hypothetical protein
MICSAEDKKKQAAFWQGQPAFDSRVEYGKKQTQRRLRAEI